MFGTQGVVEAGSYIEPGIHKVVIQSVTSDTSNTGKDFIAFTMYKVGAEPETARKFQFYFSSEGAIKMSTRKILHIGTKVVTREALDACTAPTLAEYAEKLNAVLSGKVVRMVFDGEEYYKSGDIRVAAKLNRVGDFAEACMPGAEYSVVEDSNTKLVFDAEKHVKKVEPLDAEAFNSNLDIPGEY